MPLPIPRRRFLKLGLATASVTTASLALPFLHGCNRKSQPHIVIVGGGFGGASCARYLKQLNPHTRITLIEKERTIATCPFSNYVIAGFEDIKTIQWSLDGLRPHGIAVVYDRATAIDIDNKRLFLQGNDPLRWDRLVLSPGVDMKWASIDGYTPESAQRFPHAWKAGTQTVTLKKQLHAMRDGGTVVITAPPMPYRCPPAPYERASVIAWYLQRHKPRSKVLILDSKNSFTKKALFQEGWQKLYPNLIEWIPAEQGGHVTRIDPADGTVSNADGQRWRADVLNIVPPQKAGAIATDAGLAPQDDWCQIHPVTFASLEAPDIHILGDSTVAGAMPKSAFAANSQGKALAQALDSLVRGKPAPYPLLMNTCYSLLAPDYGISVAATYRSAHRAIVAVQGSGGLSPLAQNKQFRQKEADYARAWYTNMLDEIYGS
ncbi:MAG: FAD-dependent oxidoreductase [Alphaproteobacteria bacterium GM202ARS2]|nr:FAD-dependent oxidoreductase [Alphaproteobacteria bacterium GM202ARS2]